MCFLIIAFVGPLGMTFVQGPAYAMIINLTTNLAANFLFWLNTKFLFQYAFPMMLFNVGGALLKGNDFVRVLLRTIVFISMVNLAYDILQD